MRNKFRDIFDIKSNQDFEKKALEIFRFQANKNLVYREYLSHLKITITSVQSLSEIPFLPIQFFKSHKVISSRDAEQQIFLSSGTTGSVQSKHYVSDVSLYERSYLQGFDHFYGDIEEMVVLALLPSYLEREGSSLVYMVDDLISKSKQPESGFYLNNLDELKKVLLKLDALGKKVLLIGVSFALLDLVEKHQFSLKNTFVMETGGMKGKRKEMIREELHEVLKNGFGVDAIH